MPNIPRATRELNDVLRFFDSILDEVEELPSRYDYLIEDLRDARADLHGAMSWLL